MDLVAIIALKTAVETEAPLLAASLGTTVYETALALRVPSPIVVLRTEDRQKAVALASALRARGHDVVACDQAAIATGDTLPQVRGFALASEGISVTLLDGKTTDVPWAAFAAFVRAVHRVRTESIEKTSRQKLDLGRAAMTGGILMTKTENKTTRQALDEREPVLYAFRHDGPPLLFRQTRVKWEGLGPQLRPLAHENFNSLVRILREAAPRTPYDDRLSSPRPPDLRERAGAHGSVNASSSASVDQLAHIVALSLARLSPYRA